MGSVNPERPALSYVEGGGWVETSTKSSVGAQGLRPVKYSPSPHLPISLSPLLPSIPTLQILLHRALGKFVMVTEAFWVGRCGEF
jgi:hypothetical protein